MVIDALVRHFTRGRKGFDRNAEMAAKGKLLPGLLNSLLSDEYFFKLPPKTAGREQYGEKYVRSLFLAWRGLRGAEPEDAVRTVTILTALSIVVAFHRFIAPKTEIGELIVSGGGAHNPLLMAQLESGLNGVRVRTADELGVPGDAKEAFAFAVLACETLRKQPANVPGATGAKKAAVLGKVCYAG
jgi:anhydro-N-acetylmuramic acid kinase